MSSLKELRQRLSQLQLKSSKITLSQNECVDIFLKISSLRNFNLFSSNDGMYLLTPKQVEIEIIKLLNNEGGRAELLYIAQSLDLNFNIIEKTLNEIINKSPSTYYIEQGILMNTDYLNNLIDSINRNLNSLGFITLNDLSTEFSLPTSFIHKILNNNTLNKLQGTLLKTHIENDSYRKILEKCVLSSLIATFVEVSISHLAKICNCTDDVVLSILNRILSQHNLGIIKSNTFIPNSYIFEKQNELINYFSSNGYVNKAKYTEYSLGNNEAYSNIAINSIPLTQVLIKKGYLQQVKLFVEEAINNNSWRSFDSFLPNILTLDDIQILIKNAMNVNIDTEYREKSVGLLFQDYIFISNKFISDLILVASHYILHIMKSTPDTSWISPFINYSKGKRKKKAEVTQSKIELQESDFENLFNSIFSEQSLDKININNIDIIKYLIDSEYSFANLWNTIVDHSEFTHIIYDDITRSFGQLYKEKQSASDADATLQLVEQVENQYNIFHYSLKGLKYLGVDDWSNPICIYMCRTILMKIVDNLIDIYQRKFKVNFGDLSNKKQVFENMKNQGAYIKNLISFHEAIVSRDLDSAYEVCYRAAEDVYENIRTPNKKNEKEYIGNKIKHVKSQVKIVDDHLMICHLYITYIILLNGYYIEFPPVDWSVKIMANMITSCKKIKFCNNEILSQFIILYGEFRENPEIFSQEKLNDLNEKSQSLLALINE